MPEIVRWLWSGTHASAALGLTSRVSVDSQIVLVAQNGSHGTMSIIQS